MVAVPSDWPYADEPAVCAACGSDDERSVVVDSLGLVWGGATDGGLAPTAVGDYVGRLAFRCCHGCWTDENVRALEGARTLIAGDGPPSEATLDREKVAAAAALDAERVAVASLRELDARSGPERVHLRSQDEAIESMLDAWFDGT